MVIPNKLPAVEKPNPIVIIVDTELGNLREQKLVLKRKIKHSKIVLFLGLWTNLVIVVGQILCILAFLGQVFRLRDIIDEFPADVANPSTLPKHKYFTVSDFLNFTRAWNAW
jgi:hypothetical protein